MGSCHSKISSRLQRSTKSNGSSQSTVVGDGDLHTVTGSSKAPEPELPLAFGKSLRKEFLMDEEYHNLNHASFGTHPRAIHQRLEHYRLEYERAPDPFIRYTYPALLDENRAAAARLLNAPSADEVVLVPNATVGVNTVLRGLADAWDPDGRDEVLYFSTIYGSCGKTIDYVADSTRGLVRGRAIELTYPVSDTAVLDRLRDAAARSRADGRRPRVALFDTVSSVPGVRFPFEAAVALCRELGILSLVDAAQGVGMIPLDLAALDPDFLVSNCHKWLFVPRSCAIFYVPLRNQHLIRSTLPTSHGYTPRDPSRARANPLPPSSKSAFVNNFEFVGTVDSSPYLCLKDAIEWRDKVLGGEERIREYLWTLAREGGERVAEHLGTWVMENDEGTLGNSGMTNIALPLVVAPGAEGEVDPVPKEASREKAADVEEAAPENAFQAKSDQKGRSRSTSVREGEALIPHKDAERIWEWMTKVLVDEYKTFLPLFYHAGRFWARLSAQVYLDMDDFDWAGRTLKELCQRVARKDYDAQ